MEGGKAPREALDLLLAIDPDGAERQVAFIDAKGRTAAHTGGGCQAFAGHREGKNYCVQGNLLAGEGVLTSMAEAFEVAEKKEGAELADWLLAALQAGQTAGGDRRGQQSAALLVVRVQGRGRVARMTATSICAWKIIRSRSMNWPGCAPCTGSFTARAVRESRFRHLESKLK